MAQLFKRLQAGGSQGREWVDVFLLLLLLPPRMIIEILDESGNRGDKTDKGGVLSGDVA